MVSFSGEVICFERFLVGREGRIGGCYLGFYRLEGGARVGDFGFLCWEVIVFFLGWVLFGSFLEMSGMIIKRGFGFVFGLG